MEVEPKGVRPPFFLPIPPPLLLIPPFLLPIYNMCSVRNGALKLPVG